MAIGYIKERYITRSQGHNAVKSAAYRANERLYCERTGKTFDYTDKGDCVYAGILLPESAYNEQYNSSNHPFNDREKLWNAVEEIENSHNRRKTAQLAFELQIALPKELSVHQNIDLIKSYIKENYVDVFNCGADICIHDKGDGNPHAHVMMTFREVLGYGFSKRKLRNLATEIRTSKNNYIVNKVGRNEQWELYQNQYFIKNNIDLVVDQNHIKPTVHEGHIAQPDNYAETQSQLNAEIKQSTIEAVKENHEIIVETLEKRQSVFTQRDIENLIFKSTESKEDYNDTLVKVLASHQLINLGYNEAGRLSFTTQENYEKEVALARLANNLSGKQSFSIHTKHIDTVANSELFTLDTEQKEALKYIADSGNIVCLIGRAGAGKTHTMNAVRELYQGQNIHISGAALAGKAAHGLQADAGIQSQTIYNILANYRKGADYHQYLPPSNSVLVIDEAGMIGLEDMYDLIKMSQDRNIKLILAGDPDQLQPVSYGAPFRAILERIGFVEMSKVRRQKDLADALATAYLAKGEVGTAIDHYLKRDRVVLGEDSDIKTQLLATWKNYVDVSDKDTLILAFRNEQVAEMNELARSYLRGNGRLGDGHQFEVKVGSQLHQREFASNDRIIFLKNKTLDDVQVKNGQLARIIDIKKDTVSFVLDEDPSRTYQFNAKEFNQFDHGYCATVHKAQGVSVNNCLVYAKGRGWDRFLSYVAMSRHKFNLHFFGDKETYSDIHGLKRELSRSPLRDNVLDYPLQFAIRRGQEAQTFASNAVAQIRGAYHKTRDTWNYLFNYEQYKASKAAFERDAILNEKLTAQQVVNQDARMVADLADLNLDCGVRYGEFVERYGKTWYDNTEAKAAFSDIDTLFYARNKAAFEVFNQMGKYQRALELNNISPEKLESWAKAYTLEARVRDFEVVNNPYEKGRLAQAIIDTKKESAQYVSKRDLWDAVNKYQAQHTLRIKSGQIDGFAKHLKDVEQYLSLGRSAAIYWKKSQADHFGAIDPELSVDSRDIQKDSQGKEIKPEHQQHYEKLSRQFNQRSEILAAKIMSNFAEYSKVLAVKFPHQPTYEKIIERLKVNAERHDKRMAIRAYIDPESSQLQREQAAFKLNADFKGHVGIGYEEGLIWSSVAKTAYPEKVRQFRANLDSEDRRIFDAFEEYKAICRDAAGEFVVTQKIETALKVKLGIANNGELAREQVTDALKEARESMYKRMAERHEAAYLIANKYPQLREWAQTDIAQFDTVHMHLDAKKFMYHVALHEERLAAEVRVEQFAKLSADNPEHHDQRMQLAHEMTDRIGKHRYYLKRDGINEREIWQLSTAYAYAKENERFTGEDKVLHRAIADYMLSKEAASSAWRDVKLATRVSDNNAKQTDSVDSAELIDQLKQNAFKESEARNQKAFAVSKLLGKLIDSPVYECFTTHRYASRNIDITQLIKFADDYRVIDALTRYRDAINAVKATNTQESSTNQAADQVTVNKGSYQAKQLAGEICEQYKKGLVYHKLQSFDIDTAVFYRHATAYQRDQYRLNLNSDERQYHDVVIDYADKVVAVAKAYRAGDKDSKALGNALIIERDKLAYQIAQSPSLYQEALLFEQVKLDKLDQHVERFCRTQLNSVPGPAANNDAITSDMTLASYDQFDLSDSFNSSDASYAEYLAGIDAQQTAIENSFAIEVPGKVKQFVQRERSSQGTRWNVDRISEALLSNIEQTYIDIFGEPKKKTAKEMRWSGGLIVTLQGNNAGQWYDFATENGGFPLQAITYQKGYAFKDALEEGARIAGLSDSEAKEDDLQAVIDRRQAQQAQRQRIAEIERQQKQESAQSIWMATVPVTGSVVDDYMAIHRNVYDISNTQLRLLPAGAKWVDYVEDKAHKGEYQRVEKINRIPAMVIASTDIDGNVVGVQRTYLDPKTANKSKSFATPKLSKGSIKNGAVLQVGNNGTLYIGEGIETVASAALADKDASAMVSMSVSNLKNMLEKVKSLNPERVVFLKDNDGIHAKTDEAFNKAIAAYQDQSFEVIVKTPQMLDRIAEEKGDKAKTDWNDVIQDKGLNGLRKELGLSYPDKYPREYLQRLDEWQKFDNIIPDRVKHYPHVKALADYMALEHKTCRNLYAMKMKASSKEEWLALCDNPYTNNLKSQTTEKAKALAAHERGFKVAHKFNLDRHVAKLVGVEYSDVLLMDLDEIKEERKRLEKKRLEASFKHILDPEAKNKQSQRFSE